MGTLTGKVAMITGSGGEGGFGRAIARRFAINVSGGVILH